MSNFIKAVNKVLEHEGGFVNHPDDKGGATNWGITQKVYEQFLGRPVSINDIKNMPIDNAKSIYKSNYWDAVKGDYIKSYAKAFMLFDQAVNRGPRSAIKQAQRVSGTTPDGAIGPKTLEAINKMPEKSFIDNFITESESFYRGLVASNPSQSVFLKGWLNRVESLQDYAYKNMSKIGVGVAVAVAGVGAYHILKKKKGKV
jgi:lysozyme family protein